MIGSWVYRTLIVQLGTKLNTKIGLNHHQPPTTRSFKATSRQERRLRFGMLINQGVILVWSPSLRWSPSNYHLFYCTWIWFSKILSGQDFCSQISLPKLNTFNLSLVGYEMEANHIPRGDRSRNVPFYQRNYLFVFPRCNPLPRYQGALLLTLLPNITFVNVFFSFSSKVYFRFLIPYLVDSS